MLMPTGSDCIGSLFSSLYVLMMVLCLSCDERFQSSTAHMLSRNLRPSEKDPKSSASAKNFLAFS